MNNRLAADIHDINEAVATPRVEQAPRNAPYISKEHIDALAARVLLAGGHLEGTTTTVMHALLDGKYYLGSAHSACVSPENFDENVGLEIARRKAQRMVEDKLWELEGWRLWVALENQKAAEAALAAAETANEQPA